MAIGDGAHASVRSYVAIGKETNFGTYLSCSTAIEALSCSFKTTIQTMKIDSLSTNRGPSRRVMLDKEVAGSIEHYGHPIESALVFVSALGGAITTTTLSTGVYQHVINAGNFGDTISSVSFNVRKGGETATSVWQYHGGRVNSLKLTANVGEPLRVSADYIFQDSTNVSNDVSAALTLTSYIPWTYVQGTYGYTAAAEKITGFELTISNGLKSDKDARALGQNTLVALPATRREVDFKITQRVDTTTAWTRFTGDAGGAVQLVFTGESISSSNFNKLTIDMPKVKYRTPDFELKGPGDINIADIEFDVLVDNAMTSTGYDVKFTLINTATF